MTAGEELPHPIAIDGPAASGKSSVGEALARALGYGFLDTGLMYRAFTLAAVRAGVSWEDTAGCAALAAELPMRVEAGPVSRIFLGDEDVTGLLREKAVEQNVSHYSAIPAVREVMVAQQRLVAATGRMILAGRDIGTVVLPTAPVKLFLTASEEVRAQRRASQAENWGSAEGAATAQDDISNRDERDTTRTASPLSAAADAIEIDTTRLELEQTVAEALARVRAAARPAPAPRAVKPASTAQATPRRPRRWRIAVRRLRSTFKLASFAPSFYWSSVTLLRFVLLVVARWKVHGRGNVPRHGALMVVSNHRNNTDPAITGAALLKRRVRYMAKIELFSGPFGWLPVLWGAFPVRRFDADIGAMLNAERILRHGHSLGMFPEGTRSKTGQLGDPHPGTALIALRTGATVLPCAITGTERLKSVGVFFTKPRITVNIGTPIPLTAVRRPTEQQVSELTNRIFSEIRALLPHE